MPASKVSHDVKIAVMGNDTVGKTSIANRFIYNVFHPVYVHTRGGDLHTKQIRAEKHIVNLKLVDTAGHPYQRDIISPLFNEADGIIIAYDVTNEKSFQALADWVDCARNVKSAEIVIVGNKLDLCPNEEEDLSGDLKKFADQHGLRSYIVSAKVNYQIHRPFHRLIREILKKRLLQEKESDSIRQSSETNNDVNCCLVC